MANFLVKRSLKLNTALCQDTLQELKDFPGIQQIQLSEHTLYLVYDVRKTQLKTILEAANANVKSSRWNKLKQHYYQFTDTNLAQASGHTPSCCNKAPRA
ncbi:hypothetical protein [Celerinatantimonas diazotrophica]|uniref:Cation transporter n=1 Tax=Celerinatantimonas diazotrophica TaxID=412034 RepID=A0A4R1J9I3_9GAMM|nr:hypothetical protein [Celerinatantimonas diazotrophica]TCK47084.1 hypothetical protein EV690_2779 [Celerinatantimonas diazotrophica]CAG9295853.1 hypothetical protein CEDIAZO_00987 [Celerinatantimonas diazotrophica]